MGTSSTATAQPTTGRLLRWGEQQAREYLEAAGFTNVEVQHIEGDVSHAFFVATKS